MQPIPSNIRKLVKTTTTVFLFIILTLGTNAQIKVDAEGKVGINHFSPSCQLDLKGDFYFRLNDTSVIETQNGSKICFENDNLYTPSFMSLGKSDYWWNELWALSPRFYDFPVYTAGFGIKTNKQKIGDVTDKLNRLNPVLYQMKWNRDCTPEFNTLHISRVENEKIRQLGFVASEVQHVFPEVVAHDGSGIKYTAFIPLLVKGFQEQQATIDLLMARIGELEKLYFNSIDYRNKTNNTENTSPDKGKLFQNHPNHFQYQTTIRYQIPERMNKARLQICNMHGALLKVIPIYRCGAGSTTINASGLNAGMYLYSLIVDDEIIDTKYMVITK